MVLCIQFSFIVKAFGANPDSEEVWLAAVKLERFQIWLGYYRIRWRNYFIKYQPTVFAGVNPFIYLLLLIRSYHYFK